MRKKHKRILKRVVLIIIFFAALAISLNLERDYSKLEIVLKDTLTNLTKFIISPTIAMTETTISDQTESYIIQKNINSSLEKEIQELKELLELNSTLTEYQSINATILSRNNSYWFNTITIDKGSSSGIKKDMAVITTNGLIGKITKTTKNTSEVKLLTSDDITYKTSVVIRIADKDHYAILNGYDQENNLLKVSAIDKSTPITEGDIVLTSGLGQMPQGIYIGTVVSSEIDSYNLSQVVYVKPTQDFNNIHFVTVLKEYSK